MRSACLLAIAAVGLCACQSALPRPPRAAQPESAFVEVPYPPPAARVETVPHRPARASVWIDGQWSWDGARWDWAPGGWVLPPPGARFARWALRMLPDGRLRFAPPSWWDAAGRPLAPPALLAPAVGVDLRSLSPRGP
jgi:hypothetical protein